MKIISLNVGKPKTVAWNGKDVTTGIFKSPVDESLTLEGDNFQGDGQADLKVHGGTHKAVYAYPSEHYDFWKSQLPDYNFGWGNFGENLTTAGLLEDKVFIGNVYRMGTAELTVSQPRQPCFKLGLRFEMPAIVKQFVDSLRSGFYFSIQKHGDVKAGDAIELIHEDPVGFSILDAFVLRFKDRDNRELLEKALKVEALADSWRVDFEGRLAKL